MILSTILITTPSDSFWEMTTSKRQDAISALHKRTIAEEDEEQPLVDLTLPLHLHSKRTERTQKKIDKKKKKRSNGDTKSPLDLPLEVFMEVMSYLRPSDVVNFALVNKTLNQLIVQEEEVIVRSIVSWRYTVLEKCFRAPVLLENVNTALHPILQREERQEIFTIHKKPFQHIQAPDPQVICTCMSCILRWNALNVAIDFAHWQDNLDKGEPIPMIPRGTNPKWNRELTTAHGLVVVKALRSSLWHARILELHLKTTVNSIRRQMNNKGNRRRRFQLTYDDEVAETDAFLERSGPSTLDFPFHRDNYYMLESYIPNRSWSSDAQRWMYVPASQHERDLELVERWETWRREMKAPKKLNPAECTTDQATAREEVSIPTTANPVSAPDSNTSIPKCLPSSATSI